MTTKHIYFGKYSNKDIKEMGLEKSSLFYHNGNYFEYHLEILVEDGMIRITDGCNRHMPFDVTHYQELFNAMSLVQEVQEMAEQATRYAKMIEPNTRIGLHYDPKMGRVISI